MYRNICGSVSIWTHWDKMNMLLIHKLLLEDYVKKKDEG